MARFDETTVAGCELDPYGARIRERAVQMDFAGCSGHRWNHLWSIRSEFTENDKQCLQSRGLNGDMHDDSGSGGSRRPLRDALGYGND